MCCPQEGFVILGKETLRQKVRARERDLAASWQLSPLLAGEGMSLLKLQRRW